MENRIIYGAADKVESIPYFTDRVEDKSLLKTLDMVTMQVNVGPKCNLQCKHCHVEGGPDRTEEMSRDVMEAILKVAEKNGFTTIDITGGAPELNPNMEWFIRETSKLGKVIVRSNLVILEQPKYAHFIDLYKECGVELFASLPYYTKKQMEKQRGENTFDACIRMMQKLNELGYGKEGSGLVLNLVYNPAGAIMTPVQSIIEPQYKKHLKEDFGIEFNSLFAITNNPCGRFARFLETSGNLEGYMKKLSGAFNPAAVAAMMCRSQLSVKYNGELYDCDFNQTMGMKIDSGKNIFDYVNEPLTVRNIRVANHCYACCAGAGSSCGGNTV